jgi:hypothetical protein
MERGDRPAACDVFKVQCLFWFELRLSILEFHQDNPVRFNK